MTIHYPDVSHYQKGLSLAGAVACIAKATEGTTYKDPSYASFKSQALSMGIPFAAYHWIHASDVNRQAQNAFSVAGPNVPLMIDDEDPNDGLNVDRTLAFVQAYRNLGGIVTLEYLPRWFWRNHGSPDLRPLQNAGLSLVSSNYSVPYSDDGPGWQPYGGVTPKIWQYTSTKQFNGYACDFNAFKGTVEELRALFNGTKVQGGMILFTNKGDKGPVVEALQRQLMSANGETTWVKGQGVLPKYGPDGGYGDETAAAIVTLGCNTGADKSGNAYGPSEYASLNIKVAQRWGTGTAPTPPVLVQHSHDFTASGRSSGAIPTE